MLCSEGIEAIRLFKPLTTRNTSHSEPISFVSEVLKRTTRWISPTSCFSVPRTRLELARTNVHYPLKVACLPISPPGLTLPNTGFGSANIDTISVSAKYPMKKIGYVVSFRADSLRIGCKTTPAGRAFRRPLDPFAASVNAHCFSFCGPPLSAMSRLLPLTPNTPRADHLFIMDHPPVAALLALLRHFIHGETSLSGAMIPRRAASPQVLPPPISGASFRRADSPRRPHGR